MIEIPTKEVSQRLLVDNPWWATDQGVDPYFAQLPRRSYFGLFKDVALQTEVHRAVVLMGPRRVGKTVMIHHLIHNLLETGTQADKILYVSADTPTYTGLGLENLLSLFLERNNINRFNDCFIFIDEIQYVKNWEIQLKSLVDTYRSFRFIVSGSAAAALRLKSQESGAGRFTDFMLPPLTFSEYLRFTKKEAALVEAVEINGKQDYRALDIKTLNTEFINYLNYGGYPEAAMNLAIRENPGRYIKNDIIDKVLLKDLPSLYGIQNIQELNKLLLTIAYNTGNEISLDALSQSSGVAKNTIKRYLEYLEAAFLTITIDRVDDACKTFKRQNYFKVYLANPSMRAALFHNIQDDDELVGNLAETAIISQWLHWERANSIKYARWKNGEVDVVHINPRTLKPSWAYEVKWSDHYYNHPEKLKSLLRFTKKNELFGRVGATTKTESGTTEVSGIEIRHFPCSLHCYRIGRNITEGRAP